MAKAATKKKNTKKKGPSEDKSTKPDENKNAKKKNGNGKKKKAPLSPSEAIYAFVGWLNGRDKKISMSARRPDEPAFALADEFCSKTNGLSAKKR